MANIPTKQELLKLNDNHAVITIAGINYVLPYSDGVKIMQLFINAETFKEPYNEPKTVSPLKDDYYIPSLKPISQEEYLEAKMNTLLGLAESKNG